MFDKTKSTISKQCPRAKIRDQGKVLISGSLSGALYRTVYRNGLMPIVYWLSFLTRYMPEGGEFQTISKKLSPRSTDEVQHLIDFLKHLDNSEHPYTEHWIAHLAKPKPNIWVLSNNLPAVTTCTKSSA